MTPRDEQKRAANDATFREANEQIRAAERELDPPLNRVPRLELRVREYEHVRRDARLYVISKGHEIPSVEHVVEQADGYDVVQKDEGAPADLSRQLDPRS